MPPPLDECLRWLGNAELYKFIGRYARKLTREEIAGEEIRSEAYVEATVLLHKGKRPEQEAGMRPWLCAVLKNKARDRAKKLGLEVLIDPQALPDLPADDQRALAEEMAVFERTFEAAEAALAAHPEHAKRVLSPNEQGVGDEWGKGADAAERKRKSRSRMVLASAISAALAAAAAIFLVVHRAPAPPVDTTWTDAQRAAVLRELGLWHCDNQQWLGCLFELDDAKQLDPRGETDPAVQRARQRAKNGLEVPYVADLRRDAIEACKAEDWRTCLERLDEAKRYDPMGDEAPLVSLARREAVAGLERPDAGRLEDRPAKQR